jgi:tRNA A-37 threonylcarbamoyl transferase component Bud32
MKPRAFNKVEIDYEKGVVRKSSTDRSKLESEIKFYLNSPEEVKKLMPKLYRHSADFSWYEMEYLDWPTITELANRKELSSEDWTAIFFSINEGYCSFNENIDKTDFNYLYKIFVKKALDRAEKLENQELKNIFFNGCFLNGKKQEALGKLLITNSGVLFKVTHDVGLLHGDFCFSNILIREDLKKIKLLDPRGGFEEPSIYGPKAYDIGKLAQSTYSWYDKIIDEKYKLIRSDNGYGLSVTGSDWITDSRIAFDPMLETFGLSEYDAKILAGLMLAGTPALHLDDLNRAVALALNSVLLLSS